MKLHHFVFLCLAATAGLAQAADCPRIVSQSPYISRALEWMGRGGCIVGVTRYDSLKLPRTGGVLDPDRKALAALRPDVVIYSDWVAADTARAAAPAGATVLRVGGFRGMAGVEDMLRRVGHAAGVADIDRRVERFDADWRRAAAGVPGHGRHVLVVSACGNTPYSFGKGTTVYEVLAAAGFDVEAGHDGIRTFRSAAPDGDLIPWIGEHRPELLFAVQDPKSETCNLALSNPGFPILPLSGEYFTRPGPELLKGLAELRRTMPAYDAPAKERP